MAGARDAGGAEYPGAGRHGMAGGGHAPLLHSGNGQPEPQGRSVVTGYPAGSRKGKEQRNPFGQFAAEQQVGAGGAAAASDADAGLASADPACKDP